MKLPDGTYGCGKDELEHEKAIRIPTPKNLKEKIRVGM